MQHGFVRTRHVLILLGITAVSATVPVSVAAGDHGTVKHLSIGPAGENADTFTGASFGISADGSHAWFETPYPLVSEDTNGSTDVYERVGDTTNLVSTGPLDSGNAGSTFLGASDDGSRVLFRTKKSLVASDTDAVEDIYMRAGAATTLVSTGPTAVGGFQVFGGSISADGTHVFFGTNEPLVAADTDTRSDVYEWAFGTTTLVSTGPAGGNGAADAGFASRSADGAHVFFKTSESLVADDTDSSSDIYERAGGVTLVSIGPNGGNGSFDVEFVKISADGSHVLFQTGEPLVAADTDNYADLYERSGGSTTLVSVGPAGGSEAFGTAFPTMSADGTHVFFHALEQLVAADTDNATDIYERAGGVTSLVSTGPLGGNGPMDAWLGDLDSISSDGTRAIFRTREALVAGDLDGRMDVYERAGGTTTLLSVGPNGGNEPSFKGDIRYRAASADATRVFFATRERLVAADTDDQFDNYERHGDETTWVSFGLPGGNADIRPDLMEVTPDGRYTLTDTRESLASTDTDIERDLYVHGPVDRANYPRPGSATPILVPLVPAYDPCEAPNNTHVAPLALPVCDPPQRASDFLTLGTIGQSSGFIELRPLLGNPGTTEDEADIRIESFLSDVRRRSDGADYSGELQVSLDLRITDRRSGLEVTDPATVEDQPFEFAVPCMPTAGSAGGRCSLTTSADTLAPGAATEGDRTIYDVGNIEVLDGGADDDADTSPNTLFANAGLFAP